MRHPRSEQSPAALQRCLAAAQADAERFHGGAATPSWRPALRHAGRAWLSAALALGAGLAGAVALQRLAGAVPPATAPLHAETPTPRGERSAPPPRPAERAVAPAFGALTRDGAVLSIDAAVMPRAEAARRLAALTGSELLEQPGALAMTRPLTRRWRGDDIAAAWRVLLDDAVGYALHCDAGRCRVWVFGALGAPAAHAAPRRAAAPMPAPAPEAAPPDAPMPAPAPEAAPPDAPMQPDPPGLFPSE